MDQLWFTNKTEMTSDQCSINDCSDGGSRSSQTALIYIIINPTNIVNSVFLWLSVLSSIFLGTSLIQQDKNYDICINSLTIKKNTCIDNDKE